MKYLLTIISALLSVGLSAQNIATTIDNVTVYRNGAFVNREGAFDIKKGTETYYLTDLSEDLDVNSLRLAINDDRVRVISFTREYEKNVVKKDIAQAKEKASKRIKELEDSIANLKVKSLVLKDEKELILKNKKVAGQNKGLTAEALSQMASYYKKRLTAIEKSVAAIEKSIKTARTEINKHEQFRDNNSIGIEKKFSKVKLILQSSSDIKGAKIELGYLVNEASWSPSYDIRLKEVNKPIALGYFANVSQNSKEDWENVKLTLSTGNPTIDNTLPEFEKIYFPSSSSSVNGYYKYKTNAGSRLNSTYTYGIVVDAESGEPLPGVSIIEKNTSNGCVTDMDGKFRLSLVNINNEITVDFVGYERQVLRPGNSMYIALKEDEYELDEVVVVGYGVRKNGDDYYDEPAPAPKVKKNIPLTVEKTITSTEFAIESRYSIASDNKEHKVKLLSYNMDAEYKYSCAPRFSNNVYLMAIVPECSQYALQPGIGTIYLNNAYQGKAFIEPNQVTDTLTLSAGKDQSVALSREEIRSKTAKSIFGNTITVVKCYEITIKNNKNIATKVEVEDQIPVSGSSEIKVALTESGNATLEKETGKLTWTVELGAQEQQKIRFSYEVKYPKRMRLTVY